MTPIKDKYKIVYDEKDPKKWVVQLLPACAPFHGILYTYGEFFMKPPDKEGAAPKFSFQTEIIYVPEHLRGVTFPDSVAEEMDTLLAKILVDIIETHGSKARNEGGKLYLELVKDDK